MNYKINYNRLENLNKINYYVYIIIFITLIFILFVLSFFIRIKITINTYGVIIDNKLHIKINEKLSDEVNNNSNLLYKDEIVSYKVDSIINIEIHDDEIIKEIALAIDKNFTPNDYGKVKIIVGEKRIIKYIFDLFK